VICLEVIAVAIAKAVATQYLYPVRGASTGGLRHLFHRLGAVCCVRCHEESGLLAAHIMPIELLKNVRIVKALLGGLGVLRVEEAYN